MLRRASLAVLLAAICTGAWAQEVTTRTVSPLVATAQGLDQSNDALRLVGSSAQQAGQPLCLEAEQASLVRFTPGKGIMGRDAGASGGLYVAFVDQADFRFKLAEAGTYTAWYRASFPLKGNWNHTESMDGGATQTHTDSRGEVLDQWLWVKGPTYELTAGEHVWSFAPFGWCGGTKLDRVLLSRDPAFALTGLGPVASPATGPQAGEAVTEQLRPRALVRWQKVTCENVSQAGTVQLEATTDSAVSWQPVPADGDLTKLGDKPLALRLKLQAGADGGSPYVAKLQVEYVAKPIPPLVLANRNLQLRFAGDSGALIGVRNLHALAPRAPTDYLAPEVETPLFSFVGFRPEFNTTVEIGFGQAQLQKVTPGKDELRLAYSLLGGGLLVEVQVKLAGRLARFGLTVTNKSHYEIAQVRLLSPKGLRIGGDCTDDYLLTPITTGSIVKYPASLEYPRQIYTDRPLGYPGMATMCWMDLWDDAGGGMYLACEDKRTRVTELTFSNGVGDRPTPGEAMGTPPPDRDASYRYAKVPGTYVNIGFDKRWRIPRGTSGERLPEVVVGVHEGDWHWGADQYRAWAEPWMAAAKHVPDWFRDSLGINNVHMIHLGDFAKLSKGRPRGGRQGDMKDTMFPLVAAWCQNASCEAYWSTPVLHRLLGSEEEFTGGIQKQHEMGHRFISYNLPRALNPLFNQAEKRVGCVPISMIPAEEVPPVGFYSEVGLRLADGRLRSADGAYSEANVCWGAPRWRDYEHHIIYDKYVKQYGDDGMYMDGMGLDDIGTQDCRSLTHGHETYGDWTRAFLDWLEKLQAETRQQRPGAVFLGEGMGDVYHMQLATGLFYPENAPQVYRYTCPWNIGWIMPALSAIKGWPDDGLAYASVYGLMISGLDTNFERDPAAFRRNLVFRERFHQFQSRARFLDNAGLEVPDASVTAKLYGRNDAGNRAALIVTYNPNKASGVRVSVATAQTGNVGAGWACDEAGGWRKLELTQSGDKVQFTLPAADLSACLLIERCEPIISLAEVKPTVPGERGVAHVTVTSLEGKELTGQVALQLPAGWQSEARPVKVGPGQSADVDVPFTVAPHESYDVHDIYAVVKDGSRVTKRCRPMGVCRPVQAEIWFVRRTQASAGDRVRVEMSNASTRAVSGTCELLTPAGVTPVPAGAPFTLAPGGAGELLFDLANTESVQTLQYLKARLQYGKDETLAFEHLQPPLLNGGFEQDTAGDDQPDYWNYRFPHELYVKPGFPRDHDIVAEGKSSLRLDPLLTDTRNHIVTTFVKLVPGARYKLSCQLRRTGHNGNIGLRLYSLYAKDGRNATVSVWLGGAKDGPVNVWQRFEGEFQACDMDVPYNLLLSNTGKSPETVWFDDIRLEELR